MITVTLTWRELMMASHVGCMYRVKGLFKHAPTYGSEANPFPWEFQLMGAMAELAVAKHFNLYWTGPKHVGAIDVGNLIEVRSCTRRSDCLILHPGDKDQDELPFVLVHPEAPKFHLMGWCYGHEGKQQKYWADKQRSDRPAFFVPQTDLRPIETLHVDVAMMVLPETVSEAAQ